MIEIELDLDSCDELLHWALFDLRENGYGPLNDSQLLICAQLFVALKNAEMQITNENEAAKILVGDNFYKRNFLVEIENERTK